MKRFLVAAILLAPLAIAGCKKKEPESAPVVEQPPPSPLTWAFGPATFDGDRIGGTGALYMPWSVTNGSSSGLQISEVGFTVLNGEVKACTGKADVIDKTGPAGVVSGKVQLPCDYTTLPAGDRLTGKAHVVYTLGTQAMDERVDFDVAFKR